MIMTIVNFALGRYASDLWDISLKTVSGRFSGRPSRRSSINQQLYYHSWWFTKSNVSSGNRDRYS